MSKYRRVILSLSGLASLALGGFLLIVLFSISRENAALDRNRINLKYIYISIHYYQISHGSLPTGTVPNDFLPPQQRLSWLTILASFWDIGGLGNAIDRNEAWNSSKNTRLSKLNYLTDSDPDPQDLLMRGLTPYVGIAGLGVDSPMLPADHPRSGIFGYDRVTSLGDIRDGLGTTMMVAETSRANGSWMAGGPSTVRGLDRMQKPYVGKGRQFDGVKHRGALVLFADGSIRGIKETVNPRVFEAMSTIAGGERVSLDSQSSWSVSGTSDRFTPH